MASGWLLPLGHRLAVALALVLGAGVGSHRVRLMLMASFDDPEQQRAFLIASALGLVAVVGGLVVLVRRSRAA